MTLRSAITVIVAATNVAYNYAIISWCSINIWRALSKPTAQTSARTKSLSGQMNRMLLVQVRYLSAYLLVLWVGLGPSGTAV